MRQIECVECGRIYHREAPFFAGEVICCPACERKMYVVSTDPLVLSNSAQDLFESPGISVRGSRFRRSEFWH